MTQNFLVKNGLDYFGKRDLIYLDLVSSDNVRDLVNPNIRWSDDDKPFHNTKVFKIPEEIVPKERAFKWEGTAAGSSDKGDDDEDEDDDDDE